MESHQKHFIGLTVAFAVIGVGLLVTAFATDNWVSATPRRITNNVTAGDEKHINTGNSSFGLFNGKQSLKYQTGARSAALLAVCNPSEALCAYIFMRPGAVAKEKLDELIDLYNAGNNQSDTSGSGRIEYGLFSFPLWVTTITALSLSIVSGLVTIGFSIFNVFGRPIETITGPMGLYIWNGISLGLICLTIGVFVGLYETELSKNFLTYADYHIGWRSEGQSAPDFSFYVVVGAAGAFLLNLVLLCLSGQSLACSYPGSGEKEVDNGMILY